MDDKVKLMILGAGPMGRETEGYAQDAGYADVRMVDISGVETLNEGPVICAVGDPERRAVLVAKVESRGLDFAKIIHPTAYVGRGVTVGEGCIVSPHVTLTRDLTLGRHVIVNANSSIGHDCEIGDYTYIGQGCHISGRCKVASGSYLRAGTVLQPDTQI